MNVVFMGTPDFAVASLSALIDSGYVVKAVFTQSDKPQGRKQILTPPPVKTLALEHQIPVYQPKTLRDGKSDEILRACEPDFIVVAAYGKLLPKSVLEIPKKACVNVHGSLLPKYRGAAPIQWSVINGDETTGVTTMLMAEGMDEGDILLQYETPIGPEETSGELFDRLSDLGASLLLETLERFDSITPKKQDPTRATVAPILRKEMAKLDFSRPAKALGAFVRGMNPWPVAWFEYEGRRMKVYEAEVLERNGPAGEAFEQNGCLSIYCGEGALRLCELQAENGKRMSGEDYLRGHPLKRPI